MARGPTAHAHTRASVHAPVEDKDEDEEDPEDEDEDEDEENNLHCEHSLGDGGIVHSSCVGPDESQLLSVRVILTPRPPCPCKPCPTGGPGHM